HDAAGIGFVETRDHVEERSLAGAVRADDRDDAPFRDVDPYAVDRGDAAEALGDALYRKLDGGSADLLRAGHEIHAARSHAVGAPGRYPQRMPLRRVRPANFLPCPDSPTEGPSRLAVTGLVQSRADLNAGGVAPPDPSNGLPRGENAELSDRGRVSYP